MLEAGAPRRQALTTHWEGSGRSLGRTHCCFLKVNWQSGEVRAFKKQGSKLGLEEVRNLDWKAGWELCAMQRLVGLGSWLAGKVERL